MNECPAIIAALPREVKHLVSGWQQHKLPGRIVVYSNDFAVAACAGMGPERATLAIQAAMSIRPVTRLLSVGLAGGCDPSLRVGDIVKAGLVVDVQTGERFGSSDQFEQVLVTDSAIANVKEKQRLRASYGASAVDMEAAAVARLAQAHGLSFQAIKVISDDATFEMQELSRFATPDGQFREVAFATYAMVRPHLWAKLIHLGRNTNRAIQSLSNELKRQLDLYR